MAGKREDTYFESFIESIIYACEAAALLQTILKDFKPDEIADRMKEMHNIEHAGDIARHVMTKKLAKEFITPIEREDIMELSVSIDDVTDRIEDVLMRIYMFNIREIRDDARRMTEIIVKCCDALRAALVEFPNFRKSKTLHEKIVLVNRSEEEADTIYVEGVRRLCMEERDPFLVQAWYETFRVLENCCDACEGVADAIESVTMKNS